MGSIDQQVKILERAEERIDILVVGDVVAHVGLGRLGDGREPDAIDPEAGNVIEPLDDANRKSTRLNSSHVKISYAVFCLKKKKKQNVKLDRITRCCRD